MSHPLAAYLAQDRLHALAHAECLPERVEGTVLLADLSGFTPLSEALNLALGARAGAEALSQQINQIYSALVLQIERWRGSVICFAGDALTCWFDQAHGPAAARAAACALALHQAMASVNRISLPSGTSLTLGLKVALASGPALRLAVGEPRLQLFDALAGQTLTRVAAIERRTNSGEILLDQASAAALGQHAALAGWRDDPEHNQRYALLTDLARPPAPNPWPVLPPDTPSITHLRPWLLPAVAQRYQDGLGDFLTELRPLVGMAIRFVGIDYDRDPQAGPKLDALTRAVQQALARYEGALLQLTTGDQGGWFYAAFGAPIAHEDDLPRAVLAALEIQQAVLELGSVAPLQIGISQGILIVGVYGAETRQTYAALGDQSNLASRLMAQAAPGETLLSGRGQRGLGDAFVFEPRTSIRVRSKPEPLPVTAVLARRQRRAMRLEEPAYALPMVGRADEVRRISLVLDEVAGGAGRVLAITGEAGLGKSRLVAELVRLARQRGFLGYGGTCLATGASSPYLVWEGVWRAFFDIDPESTSRKQARVLEGSVEDLAPERAVVLPLLGPLVGLSLPDNDFTRTLQPKDRQGALHALLRDCLLAAAREAQSNQGGLLLVLEDLHWIDAASLQLLGDLAEAIAALPVLLVLTYRPAEQERQPLARLEALPFCSTIALDGLAAASSEDLIRAKLAQLFPARKGTLPAALVARLTERAQGNPFFLEELLNYLHDRAIDPYNLAAVAALELPESLYSLVLSRLDQLSGQQQALLKMASVIGRRFPVAWLHGAFASQRPLPELEQELAALAHTDLIALDPGEAGLVCLFKHVVTQQVAYESLSASTRAILHGRFAAYLEELAGADQDLYLELLAYHYDRSANRAKQCHFHLLAGRAAARKFANESALSHFGRVLELTPEDALRERFDVLLEQERVYGFISAYVEQSATLEQMASIVERLDDPHLTLTLAQEQSCFALNCGDLARSVAIAEQAAMLAQTHQIPIDPDIYNHWGWSLILSGNMSRATEIVEKGLEYTRSLGNGWVEVKLEIIDGVIAMRKGEYERQKRIFSRLIRHCRDVGNRRAEALTLVTNPVFAYLLGLDPAEYLDLSSQGMKTARMIGDVQVEAWGLFYLGTYRCYAGMYDSARECLEAALHSFQKIKQLLGQANVLFSLGLLEEYLGRYEQAFSRYQQSLHITRQVGDIYNESAILARLGLLSLYLEHTTPARDYCRQALALTSAGQMPQERATALTVFGHVHAALGRVADAAEAYTEALGLRRTLQQHHLASEPLAGLARIALRGGHTDQALGQIEAILPLIDPWRLIGTLDPLDVCLTCHKVLCAAEDARAQRVLEAAHAELQRRAGGIADPAVRASFLARRPHARISALYHGVVATYDPWPTTSA